MASSLNIASNRPFSFENNAGSYLLCNYLLPPERLALGPSTITQYPYFSYVLETTDIATPTELIATSGTSNNFQLSSIPRRVYIWIAPSVGSMSKTICVPDTFLKINNVAIQFENSSSIFAECDMAEHYQMAIKNGYIGSYLDFIKGPSNNWAVAYPANATVAQVAPNVYRSGTVLCYEFGTDIQLQSEFEAAGSVSGKQYNFQVKLNFDGPPINYTTAFGADQVPALQYQIHCLFAYEGVFNILGQGISNTQINVLSEADVINAVQREGISYKDVAAVQGGSINFSNLKDITKNIAESAKKINKQLKDTQAISRAASTISDIASYVPLPYAQQAAVVARDVSNVAKNYGYGSGGVLLGTGGQYVKKSKLAQKMKK